MKTVELETKATEYAQSVSENRRIFVYEREGVYWLALRSVEEPNKYRTLQAVGCRKSGVRRVCEAIETYFEEK